MVGEPAWKRYIKYVLFELSKIVQDAVDWVMSRSISGACRKDVGNRYVFNQSF